MAERVIASQIELRTDDDDLVPLLKKCSDAELDPLVNYITQKGSASSELETTLFYKQYNPQHSKYALEICAEIQKFGGNTIVNIFRGKGVYYKEVVCNVAKKLKVNFNEAQETDFIEQQILLKILEKSWEKMSEQEKQELLSTLGKKGSTKIPASFPVALLQGAIVKGGFISYKIALIIANAVAKAILGRGLSLALNAGLARWMAIFAGPIGWAITALWTLFDIAGPAYRVTIPCVIHIAMLRQRHLLIDAGNDPDSNEE